MMSDQSIYEITRRAAAAVTRRHSFLLMAGASTAAATPLTAEAGEAGKKARKRCKRQRGACRASVEEFCAGAPGCLDHLLPCCEPLATCNARESTECLIRPQPN
jgi:hypothetical protein